MGELKGLDKWKLISASVADKGLFVCTSCGKISDYFPTICSGCDFEQPEDDSDE